MSLLDRAETLLVGGLMGFFKLLGPVRASNCGGAMLRLIGPRLPSHQFALQNLELIFPDWTQPERDRTARDAWENLGRVLGELVHLPQIATLTPSGVGMELVNGEAISSALANPAPAIFVSAHLANWEILLSLGNQMGGEIGGIYRAPHRPGVTRLLNRARYLAARHAYPLFPKGARGGRDALAYLRKGGKLGMLMDQKLNDGIAVPFMGHDAMTASALARFALRFNCAVVPFHAERLGPARYRMVGEAPRYAKDTGDSEADVLGFTAEINRLIESWIRARPGEWLWMHRRWPKQH